ncbi:MAG: hypothetical protein EAZ95_11490 [Bacteroidetes bacterium]|nr:MAG: hypothetical protein EAZ95_11490 [Bacteroidota bacterium]
MKKLLFFLFLLCGVLQGCLRNPCPNYPEGDITSTTAIFMQNGVKVIPFTKVYAIGGTGALGLTDDKTGYILPFNLKATQTSFVFEKNTQRDTLTLTYRVDHFEGSGTCPSSTRIYETKISVDKTSFNSSQIVISTNIDKPNITITLP